MYLGYVQAINDAVRVCEERDIAKDHPLTWSGPPSSRGGGGGGGAVVPIVCELPNSTCVRDRKTARVK